MIRFFMGLALAIMIIVGITMAARHLHWVSQYPSFLAETTIILAFGTGLIFVYLYRLQKPDMFVQIYLLSMAVKLIAYGAYCTFMILEDKAGAIANVSFFMASYFIFTTLEIGFLYQKITAKNPPAK